MQKRNLVSMIHMLVAILFVTLFAVILAGCDGSEDLGSQQDLNFAPLSGFPADVQAAPVAVQQAYQFAVANPEIIENIPCYCGCGPMGHQSNYACYVADKNPDGTLAYDSHALGCSICVDITQDAMRLHKQGKTVEEIRSYVDSTYAQYGPSNMP